MRFQWRDLQIAFNSDNGYERLNVSNLTGVQAFTKFIEMTVFPVAYT